MHLHKIHLITIVKDGLPKPSCKM